MRRSFLGLALTAILALPCSAQSTTTAAPATPSPQLTEEAIQQAMDKAANYLWTQQQDDGSWPAVGVHSDGPTATVIGSLLRANCASRGDGRMEKTQAWLEGHRSDDLGSLTARSLYWYEHRRLSGEEKIREAAKRDTVALAKRVLDSTFPEDPASQGPVVLQAFWATLSLETAARRDDEDFRDALWQKLLDVATKMELPGGGWGAGRNGPADVRHTAAAAYVIQTCYNHLMPRAPVAALRLKTPPEVDRALQALETQATAFLAGGLRDDDLPLTLLVLQQAAGATGRRRFGGRDLVRVGAAELLHRQQASGVWTGGAGQVSTACALQFLTMARQPVVVCQLKYDGDWNNRPLAAGHLCDWFSRQMCCETGVAGWQVLDVDTPLEDWPMRQMVLVTGSRAPKFTDEQETRLREYLLRGGLVLSAAEGDGRAFTEGVRQLCARLFPDYALAPCGEDHPLFSAGRSGLVAGRRKLARISILSNGVRPLWIHSEADLPLAWQENDYLRKHFAFAPVYCALDYGRNLRYIVRAERWDRPWPDEPTFEPKLTVTVAQLDTAPGAAAEPRAWDRMRRLMGRDEAMKLDVRGPLPIGKLAESGAPVAVLSGTGKFTLSEADAAALKKFVDGGGTLLVEAMGGATEFAASAEATLKTLYGEASLTLLPSEHRLYQLKGLSLGSSWYSRGGMIRLQYETSRPRLRGITQGDRLAVLFSDLDLTEGLLGCEMTSVAGYHSQRAVEVVRNLLFYAAGQR